MKTHTTFARERGVTTIPAALRKRAAVEPNTELVFVELDTQLWLVGPKTGNPEQAAELVAAALRQGRGSPFPKLLARLQQEDLAQRDGVARRARRMEVPTLSDEQMVALGTRAAAPTRRRGRN